MFAYLLTVPLLVSSAHPAFPTFDASKVEFNPLAFETPANLANTTEFYADGKVAILDTTVRLEAKPFGPAADHFVNPVFGVEALN
jgi:hypothetical protein